MRTPIITLWQPYLAGVLHGDGWCTNLTIGLKVKDYDFSLAFCHNLNIGFGFSLKPRLDERGYWLVRTSNKKGYFSHIKSYQPRNKEEIAAWLKGVFDSEGNASLLKSKISLNSWNRRVSMYSTDYETITKIESYLLQLGMPNVTRKMKATKGHKGTKPVYEIKLRSSQENFQCFYSLVGSSIKRKNDVLERIPKTYQPPGFHSRIQKLSVKKRRLNKLNRSNV